MARDYELQQSDDQFMAITDAMDAIASVVEKNGTLALACVNVSEGQIDAILGGKFTADDIANMIGMLDEALERLGMGETVTGVLHCWR